ncbi:MAG: response regulator [Anaerolineae bacterium]
MNSLTRDEVHEALSCLNDNFLLDRTALARHLPLARAAATVDERANCVRAVLLEAIEVLRPPRRLPFGALESRQYDVLSLRYVGSMMVSEVCGELSLGRRQVHRGLQEAEEKLAQVLSVWPGIEFEPQEPSEEPLRAELEALSGQKESLSLAGSLHVALQLVAPLARRYGASLQPHPGEQPILVLAENAVLTHVLVQMLSAAVQAVPGGSIPVRLQEVGDFVTMVVELGAPPGLQQVRQLADTQKVASNQGMALELEAAGLRLTVQRSLPIKVLVVEDNPSAIELYRRYLPHPTWELHSTRDPRLAYEAAKSIRPDAIILDIMMPKMDGWSVLAALAGHPDTASIPVIICSVAYDPELGETLGARAYLKKPVSQAQVMTVLERCLASRRRNDPPPAQRQ